MTKKTIRRLATFAMLAVVTVGTVLLPTSAAQAKDTDWPPGIAAPIEG